MDEALRKLVIKETEGFLERMKTNTCALTNEEAEGVISLICHISLNKAQAAEELNVSRATFDNLVADKKIPKGIKVKHDNVLKWYKDEIILAFRKFSNKLSR